MNRTRGVHDSDGAQLILLKKELASTRAENKLLRVARERMEAELRKAEHDGEQALRTGGLIDGVGLVAARPEVRLLQTLKAKMRELQEELHSKEATIGDLSGNARGVRIKELEVQAKVYLDEARRLHELFDLQASERSECEQQLKQRHTHELRLKDVDIDTMRTERALLKKQNFAVDEELGRWMDENEVLRERLEALESAGGNVGTGAGTGTDACVESGGAAAAAPAVGVATTEVVTLKGKLREAQLRLKVLQKDKERGETEKLTIFQELNEANLRLEAELKQERAKTKKLERMHNSAVSDLSLVQAELLRRGL